MHSEVFRMIPGGSPDYFQADFRALICDITASLGIMTRPTYDQTSKNPKNAAVSYFDSTIELLNRVRATQLPNIQKAAELFADRIAKGGLVFLFGCGHSRMMCEEMTPRQGCFVGFFALVEQSLSNHTSIVGTNGLRPPLYFGKV